MKRTTTSRRKRWFFARAMARAYREMLEKRRRKRPGSKNAKAATQRPLFAEALEPRVLFSGTPAPAETDTEAEDQNKEAAQTAEMLDGVDGSEETFDGIPDAGFEGDEALDEEDVERLAQEAIARWEASGLTDEQIAALADVEYIIDDLGADTLGYVDGMTIYLDDDAAGSDWFIDDTEWLDEEFVKIDGLLQAELGENGDAWVDAGEGIDLLSVIMHEQGHIVGLLDDYTGEPGDIMHGLFRDGERRIIDEDRAEGAIAGSLEGLHFADWTTNGNANWNDDANWDNPDTFPNGIDAVADFSTINIGNHRNINVETDITVGSLLLGDTSGNHTYRFNDGTAGTLTFEVSSGNATLINNSGGADQFNNTIILNDTLEIGGDTSLNFINNNTRISGTGGIIYNGTATLGMRGTVAGQYSYTGPTVVNSGVYLGSHSGNGNLAPGNLQINEARYQGYYNAALTRPLGTGDGE